jgi:hypothetical protein
MPIRLAVLPGNALEADVKSPKTFFRGSKAAKKTGTMPTKAIVAGAETYEEGYHAGNPGGLSDIDTDLAPDNIKEAVDIFGKVGTLAGLPDVAAEATLAMFQTWEAVGTASVPENINNGLTDVRSIFFDVGDYADVAFGDLVKIKRWRQFGDHNNDGGGEWKIQYWDVVTGAWVDWVTGIPTRTSDSWSEYSTESEVITTKIRLVVTVEDTSLSNNIRELEVIF